MNLDENATRPNNIRLTKRLFDIVLSCVFAVILFPVVVIIAALVKATSKGPVLFRQPRLGFGGKVFFINKFRKFPDNLVSNGPEVTLSQDSRMTVVGRFLERSKLDELPQLWNILIGEMSFVGPRPETLKFAQLFEGKFKDVLFYTPGIFGPNQTKFRNESEMYPKDSSDPELFYANILFPQKAINDLDYFPTSTLLSDIKWILSGLFMTVFSFLIWRKSMGRAVLLLLFDGAALCFGWVATLYIRFGAEIQSDSVIEVLIPGLALAPLIMLVVFPVTRVYRNPLRYFSETDLYRLMGSFSLVWIITAVFMGLFFSSTTSLKLAIACAISIAISCVPRALYQYYFKKIHVLNNRKAGGRHRILVCGVSRQSLELCNLMSRGFSTTNVIGIVSPDSAFVRREINGFEVLGTIRDLDSLQSRYQFEQLWVVGDQDNGDLSTMKNWCLNQNVGFYELTKLEGFKSISEHKTISGKPVQRPEVGRSDEKVLELDVN